MADDNIFDFEAFKKKLEEMKEQQEKSSAKNQEEMKKLVDLYKSLFMPSPEEVSKAATQIASSLEKAAEIIRETYKPDNKEDK